ncbi:fumarate hydratase [Mucilaginibacter sp. UR6-11]|uniref:fumarate hydratase n=1 Tax=Mucilaginibacter sp. UR6-11 TaxID=1435644 RepID=UPI001E35C72F|nr:fumarate hydratase [Mucilaginibacter sp. UR6-11]MCC8426790.1 fumarate hydratase [Mucilaginibacter sp. UR6-11]
MQKPFAVYLSALCLLLTSCSFNPALQGRGQDYLQGEWRQDSVPMQKQLLSYSLFKFKFSCDSVFIQLNSFSKVNSGMDSCMNGGHWSEYIRGTYSQSHDTLHIKGNFCNADYTLKKQAGCFRYGPYEEFFKVSKKTGSLVQFLSTSNVIPVNLHLIKKITCNPKPL